MKRRSKSGRVSDSKEDRLLLIGFKKRGAGVANGGDHASLSKIFVDCRRQFSPSTTFPVAQTVTKLLRVSVSGSVARARHDL